MEIKDTHILNVLLTKPITTTDVRATLPPPPEYFTTKAEILALKECL